MRTLAIVLAALALSVSDYGATITPVGPMFVARQQHTATLLADGTVLIAGGVDLPVDMLKGEEIFDPHTRQFHALTNKMISPRYGHAAVRMQDGRVLLIGGVRTANANSEIFTPSIANFTSLAAMSGERYNPSAVLLANGRVLAVGGTRGGSAIATAEIFNPATGAWSLTGSMSQPRAYPAIVRMNDGRVVVAGGGNGSPIDVFDPATGIFTAVPNTLVLATSGVLLPSGKVLLIGLGMIQTFDPSTQTVVVSSARLKTYRGEGVVLLPSGNVLIAGGNIDGTNLSADVLVYSPDTGALATIGELAAGRDTPTATLLSDGTVLIAGGYTEPGGKSSALAEIIDVNASVRTRPVHH